MTRRPTTRSQTKPDRDAARAAERKRLREEATALARRRQLDLARRPVAAPGNRGDGQLHIACVKAGQGDCTIMATPRGQILLFDCGSDAKDGETDEAYLRRVRAVLSGVKFMRGYDTIDVLVLTHPDTDHYNQLRYVLADTVVIENVYFSAQMCFYAIAQTNNFIRAHMRAASGIKKVVHNNDPAHGARGAVTLTGADGIATAVAAAGDGVVVDRLDATGGIRIVDEPHCTVTILAADVTHEYRADHSNANNRGSVVTLIVKDDKKVLICGDATVNTEQYLLNTAPAAITDMFISQAGHHGSRLTSSQQAFVDRVNPQKVVISGPKKVSMHHLPSEAVITRYQARLKASKRALIAEHETFFWRAGFMGGYSHASIFHTEQIFTTGSWDTIEFTIP